MAIKFNELTKIFRQVAERKREPAIDRSHKLYFIPGEYQYIGTPFCFCFFFVLPDYNNNTISNQSILCVEDLQRRT